MLSIAQSLTHPIFQHPPNASLGYNASTRTLSNSAYRWNKSSRSTWSTIQNWSRIPKSCPRVALGVSWENLSHFYVQARYMKTHLTWSRVPKSWLKQYQDRSRVSRPSLFGICHRCKFTHARKNGMHFHAFMQEMSIQAILILSCPKFCSLI